MNIFELLPFMSRAGADAPQAPADTLPAITERLNGGAGDPTQVSQAIQELLAARSSWTAHRTDLERHLDRLVADGAAEKKRDSVRGAITRASEEIKLLALGEAPLKQRLVKARADMQRNRQRRDQAAVGIAFRELLDALGPAIDRAAEIVGRVTNGELQVGSGVGVMVIPHLQFLAGWYAERRADFAAALATLERSNLALAEPTPLPPVLDPNEAPKATIPKVAFQDLRFPQPDAHHAVRLRQTPQEATQPAIAKTPPKEPPEPPRRPRKPDDLSPLEPGEVRVIVLRAGYETPKGDLCDQNQKIKLPAEIASQAAANAAVTVIEMNIDRTEVKGAHWDDPNSPTSDVLVRVVPVESKPAAAPGPPQGETK